MVENSTRVKSGIYQLGHPAVEVLAQADAQSGHSKVLHQGAVLG